MCERKFVPAKKIYGGLIHMCDQCVFAADEGEIDQKVGRTDRYVGKMTEKGNEGIIIFRTDIATHKTQLKLEARRGMSPNLNITSPVNELVRQQEEEGKRMEKEPTISQVLEEKKMRQKMKDAIDRSLSSLTDALDQNIDGELTDEEYCSEARQIAINILLYLDGHVDPDETHPAKDIEYRVKEGN